MNKLRIKYIFILYLFVALNANADFDELLDVGYKHGSAAEKSARQAKLEEKQSRATQVLVAQCAAAKAKVDSASNKAGGRGSNYPCPNEIYSQYSWSEDCFTGMFIKKGCTSGKGASYKQFKSERISFSGQSDADWMRSYIELANDRLVNGYEPGYPLDPKESSWFRLHSIPIVQCWLDNGLPAEGEGQRNSVKMPEACTPEIMAKVNNGSVANNSSGDASAFGSSSSSKRNSSFDSSANLVGKPCKWMFVTDEESCSSRPCFYRNGDIVAVGSKAYMCNYSKWEILKDCSKDSLGSAAVNSCAADIATRYGTPQTKEVPAQKLLSE